MDEKKSVILIRIAAVISCIWALLYLLALALVLFIGIRENSLREGSIYLVSVLIFFVIYCAIGFGLIKLLKWAGFFSLFISGLNLLLGILILLVGRNMQGLFPLLMGTAMFTLTILGWKALK